MADHDATLPPPITRHDDDDLGEADLEGALRRRQQGRQNVREGREFEERVASLFELLGFSATVGYQLDDLQFDIRMEVKTGPLRSYVLVECKKWERPVGQREVRQVRKTVSQYRSWTIECNRFPDSGAVFGPRWKAI